MTRFEVSKISIMVLMNKCKYNLIRFLTDKKGLREYPLPKARLEDCDNTKIGNWNSR
ncbi:hypothetical protein RYX36_032263, partial [Vicia faba]